MTDACPNCGFAAELSKPGSLTFSAVTGNVYYKSVGCHLSPMQLQLFECLLDAGKRGVARAQIYDSLYGMRPDCDQPSAESLISVMLANTRRALQRVGLTIKSVGWSDTRYILAELDPKCS